MTSRRQSQGLTDEDLLTKLEAERSKLTWEGLASVDAGRVVDHQVVRAWVESLRSDRRISCPRSNAS
jgi:predicted transcriptional regulator